MLSGASFRNMEFLFCSRLLQLSAPSRKEDPNGDYLKKYDIGCLRYLFLAGERLDPDTYHWASDMLKIPVVDHWWQTETGWPIAANCMGIEPFPIKAGSPTKPVPGYNVQILDSDGNKIPDGEEGSVVIKLPLPRDACPHFGRMTNVTWNMLRKDRAIM